MTGVQPVSLGLPLLGAWVTGCLDEQAEGAQPEIKWLSPDAYEKK